jgi:DNA-binding IscR family transcriptional regulator
VDQYAVLNVLWKNQAKGRAMSLERLSEASRVPAEDVESQLRALEKARWVTTAEDGRWLISRDLDSLRLSDLYTETESALPGEADLSELRRRGQIELLNRLADADVELRRILDVPLKELFGRNQASETPPGGMRADES